MKTNRQIALRCLAIIAVTVVVDGALQSALAQNPFGASPCGSRCASRRYRRLAADQAIRILPRDVIDHSRRQGRRQRRLDAACDFVCLRHVPRGGALATARR